MLCLSLVADWLAVEANRPEYGLHDRRDAKGERWGYNKYLRTEQVQPCYGDEVEGEQAVMGM